LLKVCAAYLRKKSLRSRPEDFEQAPKQKLARFAFHTHGVRKPRAGFGRFHDVEVAWL
jgi:hypothetical protein